MRTFILTQLILIISVLGFTSCQNSIEEPIQKGIDTGLTPLSTDTKNMFTFGGIYREGVEIYFKGWMKIYVDYNVVASFNVSDWSVSASTQGIYLPIGTRYTVEYSIYLSKNKKTILKKGAPGGTEENCGFVPINTQTGEMHYIGNFTTWDSYDGIRHLITIQHL